MDNTSSIGAAHAGGGRGQAWSLPNILTYGRIAAIPVVVVCLFMETNAGRWIGLGIYIAAGVTDWLDGYLARAWQQQSLLGRMLDPIADKLLVACVLLMLVSTHVIDNWSLIAAVVILSREILVSGLREFLAGVRVSMPVTRLAKWKTGIQMTALGFLILGQTGDRIVPVVTIIGLVLLWIAAIVTIYTGWDYLRAGLKHVMEQDG